MLPSVVSSSTSSSTSLMDGESGRGAGDGNDANMVMNNDSDEMISGGGESKSIIDGSNSSEGSMHMQDPGSDSSNPSVVVTPPANSDAMSDMKMPPASASASD
jgi:hypothetical protein